MGSAFRIVPMKRSAILLFMIVFWITTACLSTKCFAEDNQASIPYHISDTYGLLQETEWKDLEDLAEQLSQQYNCGIYVITVDDYTNYMQGDVLTCAEMMYQNYNLGYDDQRNGILLFLSMDERDYALIAFGQEAHYAFTDYGKDVLSDSFLDHFRKNDWYGGFLDFIRGSGDLLERAKAGQPLDIESGSTKVNASYLVAAAAGISCFLSFLICSLMKRKMKTVRQSVSADGYLARGGLDLTISQDVFLNQHTSRMLIRDERGSGSGHGGGTTIHAGGFSGKSGKF